MRAISISFVTIVAVAATACGGDDDPSASEFISDFAGGICAKAYDCMSTFPGTPTEFSASFGASESACPAGLGFISGAQLQTAVDAGRVMYDAGLGGQCVSDIAAYTCPTFWAATSTPAACAMALAGTVANGGTCSFGAECVSGVCDGTCIAPGATAGSAPGPQRLAPQSIVE